MRIMILGLVFRNSSVYSVVYILILSILPLYCWGAQDDFLETERELQSYFEQIISSSDDEEKKRVNHQITSLFRKTLEQENAFTYPFDSLKYVSKLTSPDKKVRLYTWNLALNNGTHQYFGFIHYYQKSEKRYNLFFLKDEFDLTSEPDTTTCTHKYWYGAIYYQVIPIKIRKREYYTLLGVDLNDLFTTKKLIEIIYFTEDGVKFGFPIFSDGINEVNRVVFEYSSQVSMNLKYVVSEKMIIFDHLAPSSPAYAGQYMYYGPDSSLDGFKFADKKWVYTTDLDVKMIN